MPWLQEGTQTLEDLKANLAAVTKKMNTVADYFCQDCKKFKLEDLFSSLLKFLKELENAQKVSQSLGGVCAGMHVCVYWSTRGRWCDVRGVCVCVRACVCVLVY